MQPTTPPLETGKLLTSERMLLVLMASAIACVVLSLFFGALGALYYVPGIGKSLRDSGISLVQLRPLHTTFASSWIFLGAVACAYKYLFDTFGEPTDADRKRFRTHMILWGVAGLGALVTLPFGLTSGREYLGILPIFSLMIFIGWILFAWTFISKVRPGFWARPVYVYMWTVGILYFLWTFAEGHAYLLPFVREHPVADLQVQWKSCGTLVAAFNQMVYGALIYFGERKVGDKRIGQSPTGFALFGVGLLNSFVNYAHHTYHLPQSHAIKWVAFVVSMLEIILLVRMFHEITVQRAPKGLYQSDSKGTFEHFVLLSKRWNLFLLTLAIAISVPPWNALIHGTHVVMGHAMGSELAIDSYILLAAFAFMLNQLFPKREVRDEVIDSPTVRSSIHFMNAFLVALVALLLASGLTTGIQRYLGQPMPAWLEVMPYGFIVFGIGLAFFFLRLLSCWLPVFLRPAEHRVWRN